MLADGRQRYRAIRVLDVIRAWLAQYPDKPQRLPPGPPIDPEDHAAELEGWRTVLEATTGILVFLSLAQEGTNSPFGQRGQTTQFTRASQAALQGLQCAFPEDISEVGSQQAIYNVLDICLQTLTQSFPNEASTEVMEVILHAIGKALQSYLIS